MEYNELQLMIDGIERKQSASQLHGLICGFMCAGSRWRSQDWYSILDEWFLSAALPADLHQSLSPLAAQSLSQLEDHNLGFSLLMPADNQSLAVRTQAISVWCRGFLEGFGLSGRYQQQDLSADVAEFLHDLSEISQVNDQVDGQDSEADFCEVEEYVRVGAILIFTECGEPKVH